MKNFLGIIILILVIISTNIGFANNNDYKIDFYNYDNVTPENIVIQTDPDTIPRNNVSQAPPIITSVCLNTSVTLTNTAIPGGGHGCSNIANYVWNFGDGTTAVSTQLTSPQSKTHTYSLPGLYTVTLTSQNGCGTITNTLQICVEPPPVPTFTLDVNQGCGPLSVQATNTTNTSLLCSTLSYSWDVTYTAGNCGTTGNYSYTNGTNSSTTNPSFQFVNPGTYTIKLSVTNFCGTYFTTQKVVVKQPPTVSVDTIPDFCGTATINPTAVVNSCSQLNALSYAWSFPGGSPSLSTNANPTNIFYSTPGTYTVLLNVTNECGVSVTDTKTFTVKKIPVLTNNPLSQAVCSGMTTSQVNLTADIPGTTFAWTATATPGISGFTATGTTDYLPPQTITTTSASPGTITYAITPSFNGCSGAVTNYVVNVNPAPIITLQPTSSAVCINGTPNTLAVAFAPVVDVPIYQWYSFTGATPATPIPGATNSTYLPPTSALGSTSYYCIISFTSGVCANLISNTATVDVNPLPVINSQPTPMQNICVGGNAATLNVGYTGGAGNATYQWYSNSVNSNFGGIAIPSATNAGFTPSGLNTVGQYYYYVTVTLSGNNCGSVLSNVAEVDVVPDPTVSSQPIITQTLCQGTIPSTLVVSAAGGVGTYNYQWYQNTVNSNSGGTLIAGATNNSYVPTTAAPGTTYYYCQITQTGLNCNVTSNTAEVIVKASPVFVTQPVSSDVCIGGMPAQLSISTANGVGIPTYQWYSNSVNNSSSGAVIPGATGTTYNPSGMSLGITYYYCVATFPSGGCNVITSNVAKVSVNPPPVISTQPTLTQNICVGGTIGAALSVGYSDGAGNATYQWYSNTTNSNAGGTLIPGATISTYTPPAFNAPGNYYYYAVVTLSGSNCGSAVSNPAEIVVVPDPTVSSQPIVSQTICQNSVPSTLVVSAIGGVGTYTYQWFQNAANNTTTGILIAGATSNSFIPPTTTVGTNYYYCVIKQTGLNCNVTSNTSEVIVNSQPTVVNQPASSTVCVGGTPAQLSVSYANGVGAPTYQWFSNTVNDNSTGTPILGETGATYNPLANSVGTTYYYCTITFSLGGCNTIVSNTAAVIANPLPTISVQPMPTQEICAGNTIAAPLSVSYTGGVGLATYQWYSNASNSNVGGVAIPGATNSTYTPPIFPVSGSYYYYVTVALSGNGCGFTTSNAAEIVVDPNPVVSPQSVPTQTICVNTIPQTLSITASGGLGGYTYQWYENTVNNNTTGIIIPGATSNSYVPVTTSTGTGYFYCVVTSTLGAGCGVPSNVATVIINPEPTFMTQPASSTVCVGGAPTTLSVTYINGAGTPSYQWFSNTINDSSTGTPIALAINPTYTPSSVAAGILYYYCVVTLAPGGCSVLVSNVAQVTVNPVPVISSFTREICNGTSFTVTPQDIVDGIVPAGTTYTWSSFAINPAGSVTGASTQSVAQSSISQTLTNTTTAPATVTYIVTPQSGACPGNDFTISVTVNPTIVPTVAVQNISCFGVVDGALSASISGGVGPYTLSWTGPGGFTSTAASISNLHAGNYDLMVTDSKGCQVSSSYTIIEPAEIKITTDIHKNNTFFGANNGIIGITITGGTPPYTYSWTKDGLPFATTEDLNNIAPGQYEVTVSDANSCGPKYAFYDVTVPPALIVSLVSKTDLNCYGDNTGAISVDVVGGTPIQVSPGVFDYLYSWTGPNGFTSTSKDLTGLFAGTYVLTVTDNSGFSKQLTVILTQPTAIDIAITSVPKLDCATKVVSQILTANVSGGNSPYTLAWSRGTVSGLNNEIMTSSQAGSVTLKVTDAMGCVVDSTFNLSISPTGIASKVLDCDKHTYQFDAIVLDPLGSYTYNWNFGDGGTDTNKTVNHSFATSGSKTVKLTISSSACSIDYTQLVTVEAPPVLTLDKDPKVCSGDSTIIHVSGADTYKWNDNSTGDSIMINRTGEYSVIGTSKSGCTAELKFMVSNFNLLKYTVQSDKNEISTTNSTVRFWSESIPSSQYSWDFGDGKSAQGNNLDHIYSITDEKSFTVRLKVINPNGCEEFATKKILVVNASMYNTFSPNGDGIDDVFMKSWHIKVYNRNGILIYDGSDGWDGTYKGKPVSNDTYFFVVYYSSETGTKTNSGYVTVVR
jgi:FOG: PKD repeat